jgi:hypothetical protein
VITGIYPSYYEMKFCVVFLLLEFFFSFSFSFIIREQPHSVKRGVAVWGFSLLLLYRAAVVYTLVWLADWLVGWCVRTPYSPVWDLQLLGRDPIFLLYILYVYILPRRVFLIFFPLAHSTTSYFCYIYVQALAAFPLFFLFWLLLLLSFIYFRLMASSSFL